MSKTPMCARNLGILKYLAERGPRTLEQLQQRFPSIKRHTMQRSLATLSARWWLKRSVGGEGHSMWELRPDAYHKLPSVGLHVTCPAEVLAVRGRGRPRDVAVLRAPGAAPARTDSVWQRSVYTAGKLPPARAGALDFLACPSRGF